MIRYILKCQRRLRCGWEGKHLHIVDGDAEEVERLLRDGGFSEDFYEAWSLVGVEVVDDPKVQP